MQSKAATIAKYVAELPGERRLVIESLIELVRSVAPSAVGTMKYGMPTYEIGGRMIAFNAQRNYFSFYADPEIVSRFRSDLKHLDVGKSCIRFSGKNRFPIEALKKVVKAYTE